MRVVTCCVLLLVAISAVMCQSFLDSRPVHDHRMIARINANSDVGWTATKYPRFEGMTLGEARKLLGAVIVDPVNNLPRKTIQQNVRVATTFDSREKWGHCVHEVRDQGVSIFNLLETNPFPFIELWFLLGL